MFMMLTAIGSVVGSSFAVDEQIKVTDNSVLALIIEEERKLQDEG